jgi:hypothetical protein
MAGESKITTDHETIKRWAEERGGQPARIRGTGDGSGGLLRLKFTDDPDLEQISWNDFFEEFEKNNLAFLYQDETADGRTSRFFKFIDRSQT